MEAHMGQNCNYRARKCEYNAAEGATGKLTVTVCLLGKKGWKSPTVAARQQTCIVYVPSLLTSVGIMLLLCNQQPVL